MYTKGAGYSENRRGTGGGDVCTEERTKGKITLIYLCIGNNLRRPYIYERVGESEGGSLQR